MRRYPRLLAVAVVVVTNAITALAGGCSLEPTNPFDPETPADKQQPGHIVGRVVIDGRDFEASPVTLRLADDAGRPVERDGAPLTVTTRVTADGLPKGFVDDQLGAPGTFDVEVAPGSYALVFNAAENAAPTVFDASVGGIAVFPGGAVRADVRPGERPPGTFSGVVTGRVAGAQAGRAFNVRLEAVDRGAPDQLLALTSDGAFRFDNVPPGASYRVKVESEIYAPAATQTFQIAASATAADPVDVGTLGVVLMRNLFSVDHGASEAPFVNATDVDVVMDGSLLIIDPTFATIEIRAGLAGTLVDATSGWVSVDAPAAVDLTAGEDPADIDDGDFALDAQLRLCFQDPCDCPDDAAPGSCLSPHVSGFAPLDVTLDREPPQVLSLSVASLVRCADFGDGACPVPSGASPVALPLQAALFDVTGRVTAFGLSFDDVQPALTDVSAAGSAVARVATVTPPVDASDADLTLRLFAKDAAGNVAVVDTRAIHVDVTPLSFAAGGGVVVVDGTALRTVDGNAGAVVIPGDVVDVDVDVTEGADAIARWQLVREGGALLSSQAAPSSYAGPVSAFFGGGLHRESVTLRAVVEDDAGNASTSPPFQAILWRAGDATGTARFEGGAQPAFTASLVSTLGGAAVGGVTSASTGAIAFSEVPLGAYTLHVEAPGFVPLDVPGVIISSNVVTDLGAHTLLLPRGDLAGRFVLEGQESSLNNSGIQVSIVDGASTAVAAAITLADGSWRVNDLPEGTGYSAVGFFPGFVPSEVNGLAVVADTLTIARPDADGAPTPITLRELQGDFTLCAVGTGFLDDACTPLVATNLGTVRIGGISADGFADFRVSKTPFPPDESGFIPFTTGAGGKTIAPTLSLVAPADEHTVTVFLQLRASPGNLGPVLQSQLVFDVTPPTSPRLTLAKGPGALKDGFTSGASATCVVGGDAGSGDVSAIGDGFVLFANAAPSLAQAQASGTKCSHDVNCAVALDDLQERTHTAFAFVCDQAGNCTAAPVTAKIVRDVTPPRASDGVTLVPVGPLLSGGEFFTPSAAFDVTLGVGHARTAGGANVVDVAGNPVADVLAVRFGSAARPASGNGSFNFGARPFAVVDVAVDSAVAVAGPGLPAVDGAYRVFAQYEDAAGNISEDANIANFFDVTRDSAAPNADVIVNGGALFTRDTTVPVAVTADPLSPPASLRFSTDGLLTFTEVAFPLPLGTTVSLGAARPDGSVTVTTRLVDKAGNTSDRTQALVIDRAAPTALVTCTSCTSSGGTLFSNASPATVTLQVDAVDGGALDTVSVTGITTVPFTNTLSVALPVQNGVNNLTVVVADVAGNTTSVPLTIVHDRVAPTATLAVNGGAAFTSSATVTLAAGASAETPATMRIANGPAASGPQTPFAPLVSWPLDGAGGDGAKQVTLEVSDAAGNANAITRTITLDTTKPTGTVAVVGGTTLGDGTKEVTATNIQVQLAFPADAVNFVLQTTPLSPTCDNAPFPAVPVAPPSTPVNVTLAPTSGAGAERRSVFVCVKDRAGNTAFAQADMLLDQTRPSGSLVLANGAAFSTAATGVTAVVGDLAGDETQMKKGIDTTPDCASAAGYEAFQSSFSINFANTAGPHTLQLCLKDVAGNFTTAALADSIVVDLAAPSFAAPGFRVSDGAAATTSPSVTLAIPAGDAANESGVSGMRFATGSPTFSGAFEPFVANRVFSLPAPTVEGTKTVCVEVVDGAGRTSSACDDIFLDLSAPVGSVVVNGNATFATSTTVTLAVSSAEAGLRQFTTAVQPNCDAVADASYAAFTSPLTINNFALGAGEGTRGVFTCFKDGAGRTGLASDTIIVDTVAPPPPDLQEPAAAQRVTTSLPAFRWSASAGADVYRVTVRSGGAALAGFPVDVTTTQLVPAAALPNADLTYEILARDLAGNQSALAGPRAFTVDASVPTVPGSLAVLPAATTNDNTPTLRFNLATDTQTAAAALTYRIDIAEDAAFTAIAKAVTLTNLTSSPSSFTPTNALADGKYFWRVAVSDQAGNTTTANGPSFTIDTTPPGAPVITAPASPSNTTAPTLTWSSVAGATDYHVTITQTTPGTCAGAFTTQNANTTATTFVPSPALVGGARCHYRLDVHARDALQNEGAGDAAELIVDTVAPVINGAPNVFRINDGAQLTNDSILSVLTSSDDAVSLKVAFKQSGVGTSGAPAAPTGPGACALGSFAESDFNAVVLQPNQPVLTLPVPPNAVVSNAVTAGPANACKMLGVKYFDDAGNATAANAANTTAVIRLDTIEPDVPRISTTTTVEDAASIVLALGVDSLDHNFAGYQIRNGSASFVDATPIDPACLTSGALTCTFNVALNQDVENRIAVRAVDTAGNASAEDFLTIREDSTAPAAPATIALTPGDAQIHVSWSPTSDVDLGGYRVYYTLRNGFSCPTTPAGYNGTFAVQGNAPVDVGFNTDVTLTGLPNGVAMCVAVTAIDLTAIPGPKESTMRVSAATPYELAPVLRSKLTAARLGIGAGARVGTVAVRKGLLYAATTDGLVELDVAHDACLDVTDDAAFATCAGRVKSAAALTDPRDIVLQGGFAFVADGSAGLRVFRVVEGQAPVLRHTIGGLGNAVALASTGSTLVVAGDGVGFSVFDLNSLYSATPSAPAVVSTIPSAQAFDVDMQGNVVMVAPQVSNALFFDVSNPASPAALPGSEQCPVPTASAARMSGREAYTTGGGSFPTIFACNMDNAPSIPVQDGSAATDIKDRIELAGPYAFVLGGGVVDVIDVSTRTAPRFLGNFADEGGVSGTGGLAVEGNRAFYATGAGNFVDVLSLAPLNGLELVTSTSIANGGRNMRLMGNELIDGGTGGLSALHTQRTALTGDVLFNSGQAITFAEDAGVIASCVFNSPTTSSYQVFTRAKVNGFSSAIVSAQPPNSERAVECAMDWPYLLMVSAKTVAGPADDVRLRTVDARGGAGTAATKLATILDNGGVDHLEQLGQSTVAVYGGFAFVTVKTQNGSTQGATEGLYRLVYNQETGNIGASTQVLPKLSASGVMVYGRRLYFWDNSDVFAASLDNPGALAAGDFVQIATNASPFQNGITIVGDRMLIPRSSVGTLVERIVIPTTGARTPTALTGVTTFAFGSFATAANVAGDRLYVSNLNSGINVLRLR